ncbi:acyl-ACP--UDP-N-acetylglucosamine O-acyltransferase [Gymnodinialimonas hymeniacidonis]|uniref:acyl-ACP--UDP-N-acetylglucosamine O-acyltransferase n=1 Tax=Gymnodinialimonas hymeniacidonis TaxID=3126508 RepID=UPI0034C67746
MAVDPSARVHPSAVVEDGASIGPGCDIGPFCVVGPEVTIGADVVLKSHVVVAGWTEIGDGCEIFPFASIGEIPQDKKFGGERTRLIVGKRNRIREGVTMNTGTEGGGGVTKVGDDGLFLANCHVAHDCIVGDRVVMVNSSALAGHCIVGDDVILGGLSGVHQFVRIGRGVIVGALSMVTNDVIPYGLVQGPRGRLDGLNLVGLKRRGVAKADITALRAALQALKQGEGASFQERARRLGDSDEIDSDYVRDIVDFVMGESDRSYLTPE